MSTPNSFRREKRSLYPRKVFSPSASMPVPTYYLIYMEDTVSYSIVARTSIKKIQGKLATLIVNKKKLIGEIIVSGTFEHCQVELNNVQKASQSVDNDCELESVDSESDNDELNDDNHITEMHQSGHNKETNADEMFDSEDDTLCNQGISLKRKLQSLNTSAKVSRPRKRFQRTVLDEIAHDSNNEEDVSAFITTRKQTLSTEADAALKSIEHKINDFGKKMVKMSQAIRQMASCSTKSGSQNLDCYRDLNSQENFSSNVDYNGINLVNVTGKDFGDFARRVMRILYTTEELRTHILPPGRAHLARKPLDSARFDRLHEAVKAKYKLSTHLYDDFFKYHLGPKLGDFLIEERRRESIKNARQQARLAVSQITVEPSSIQL